MTGAGPLFLHKAKQMILSRQAEQALLIRYLWCYDDKVQRQIATQSKADIKEKSIL